MKSINILPPLAWPSFPSLSEQSEDRGGEPCVRYIDAVIYSDTFCGPYYPMPGRKLGVYIPHGCPQLYSRLKEQYGFSFICLDIADYDQAIAGGWRNGDILLSIDAVMSDIANGRTSSDRVKLESILLTWIIHKSMNPNLNYS